MMILNFYEEKPKWDSDPGYTKILAINANTTSMFNRYNIPQVGDFISIQGLVYEVVRRIFRIGDDNSREETQVEYLIKGVSIPHWG